MKLAIWLALICAAAATAGDERNAYVLGPHDQVKISALHVPEIPADAFAVDDNGQLHLPLVGTTQAGGLTVDQLEKNLSARLKEYVLEPNVSITVVSQRNLPVSVIGAVKTPGVYQVREKKRLIEVLSLAGGLADDAGARLSLTRRGALPLPLPDARPDTTGGFQVAEVEIEALLKGQSPTLNVLVEAGDVIAVRRAEIVYVIGDVKKAGGFTLRDRESVGVLQALALAEGTLSTAAQSRAKIMRRAAGDADNGRTEISVNLKRVLEGRDPDLAMQPDDILVVPSSTARRIAIRTAEAAVQTATGVIIWRR